MAEKRVTLRDVAAAAGVSRATAGFVLSDAPGMSISAATRERVRETARGLGWQPFRSPAAILSQVYEGRPGCEYHGYCSGAGCPIGAKSSTTWTTIPKAQATGNFKVVGRARVMEILVDTKPEFSQFIGTER